MTWFINKNEYLQREKENMEMLTAEKMLTIDTCEEGSMDIHYNLPFLKLRRKKEEWLHV